MTKAVEIQYNLIILGNFLSLTRGSKLEPDSPKTRIRVTFWRKKKKKDFCVNMKTVAPFYIYYTAIKSRWVTSAFYLRTRWLLSQWDVYPSRWRTLWRQLWHEQTFRRRGTRSIQTHETSLVIWAWRSTLGYSRPQPRRRNGDFRKTNRRWLWHKTIRAKFLEIRETSSC